MILKASLLIFRLLCKCLENFSFTKEYYIFERKYLYYGFNLFVYLMKKPSITELEYVKIQLYYTYKSIQFVALCSRIVQVRQNELRELNYIYRYFKTYLLVLTNQ